MQTPAPRAPRPLRVLTVCTGNICRSPAAQLLLTAGLGHGSGIEVTSAGTWAVVGAGVSAPMARLVSGSGAAGEGFVARQLTADLVREADLVLALTREHRSAVVGLEPSAVRRTFTLRELARLMADRDPAESPTGGPALRLAAAAHWAARHRRPHPVDPALDDVEDPYGGSALLYARVFEEIRLAVDVLVAAADRSD